MIEFDKSIRIGIVGTAKNTGKTTVLAALMNEARRRCLSISLTGIGYDGEAIDNLTLLPKPRVDVYEGIHICTAEQCVQQATASSRLLETTDVETSLGSVQLIKIESEGRIMLAGPNNTEALRRILSRLRGFAPLCMIDGALGRMVPMAAADAVIFATGAARSTHIKHLADEMKAVCEIFHLDGFPSQPDAPALPDFITVYDKEDEGRTLAGRASLLSENDAEELIKMINSRTRRIAIPGAAAIKPLRRIIECDNITLDGIIFHLESPTMLLAGGKPLPMRENLRRLCERGARLSYHHPIPILAVTINPFYPHQIGRRGYFEPAYVDEDELTREFKNYLSLPVFNIVKDGASALFDLIERTMKKGGSP